jgi:nitrite reductase/ring-hydroxylating ferredoxin subunit
VARHAVGGEGDFPPDQVRVLRVIGERVCVVQSAGKFYAFEDRCTHDDGPLGEGTLQGCEIECPRHGARFDIRTGRVTAPPAYGPLEVYPTVVEGGQVFVEIPD